jgi:hypothetical protein
MYMHCLGHFSQQPPTPTLSSLPPCFEAEPVLPLSLILFKRRHKQIRKAKCFLLLELRIAIQKIPSIAFMYKCVTTQVDSSLTDLCTGSWSPSHVNLYCFKVSVLVPLEWEHQTLSYFGFLTYPHNLPYVLSPCHVTQVQPHCCICPRSEVCI